MATDTGPLVSMSVLDRSTYYKGLLVLVGKDRVVDAREREMMLQIGQLLDFDKRFCDAAIDDLLKNAYLARNPILFSNREIAECFLSDAIRLAFVDQEMHRLEWNWLKVVAATNSIPEKWLEGEVERFRENKEPLDLSSRFAIQKYLK